MTEAEGRQARTMEETQLKLNFDRPQGRPGPGPRTRRGVYSPQVYTSARKEEPLRKEESLLIHYHQGSKPYCALYALATLEGLDPNHVIKIAKKTSSELRTRYTGHFWQINRAYARLGCYFPFDRIPDPDTQRTREVDPRQFSGKGHIRLQKRKASNKGHQVCYKNGIIYDSSELGPQPARLYLTSIIKRRYHYIIVKPQQVA